MTVQLLECDIDKLKMTNSYWTAREIAQQPKVWRDAFASIEAQRSEIDAWLEPLLANPRLRIVLCGAGTSSFIGETIVPWLRARLDCRLEALSTTDIVGDPAKCFAEDIPTLMISYARSGDSPESAGSVKFGNQLLTECHHLVLTCNPNGYLAKSNGQLGNMLCLLMPAAAHDRGFAMTSSFTSMMVSTAAIFVRDFAQLTSAVEVSEKIIATHALIARKSAERKFDRLVVLGTGCLFGIAHEAALKCLELSAGKLVAQFDSPLGFRHGPKSVVNSETLIIHLQSANGYSVQYDHDLSMELRRDYDDDQIETLSPEYLNFDSGLLDEFWVSLPYIVYCQMFAFYTALTHGITADNPCPTGEVNRVVQGVEIHPFDSEAPTKVVGRVKRR